MASYYIIHIDIIDWDKLKYYSKSVSATLKPFDGKISFQGKRRKRGAGCEMREMIQGKQQTSMIGVFRFPNKIKAKSWYTSAAYQALIPIRDESTSMTVVQYDSA